MVHIDCLIYPCQPGQTLSFDMLYRYLNNVLPPCLTHIYRWNTLLCKERNKQQFEISIQRLWQYQSSTNSSKFKKLQYFTRFLVDPIFTGIWLIIFFTNRKQIIRFVTKFYFVFALFKKINHSVVQFRRLQVNL